MNDFEWNVVNEGLLLDAMVGHKPVGVNKYFQMAFICDKFTDHLHKDIDPEKVWVHLETMYNLEALDECEALPFPNNEREFKLPESDFGSLINKKDNDDKAEDSTEDIEEDTRTVVKEIKKEDKGHVKNQKEHSDSKEGKDNTKVVTVAKKEQEKAKPPVKGRNSIANAKDDNKTLKSKTDDAAKLIKRPTRGSLKSNDDSGSSGKSSPINVILSTSKRRRIF